MRLGIAAGPALLLLWQVAPIDTVRDSSGRTRIALGFGAGQFEQRVYACNGQLVSAAPAKYQTAGLEVDHWAGRHVRLSGFGGKLESKTPEFAGGFGGVAAAWEGGPIGLGAGITVAPIDSEPKAVPSLYLRLGSINRIHFRADLFNPEPAFGTTGILRMGLGGNQGMLRGPRWFAGVSVPLDASGQENGGAFGELSFPVARQFELTTSAALRAHARYADWGLAFGLRYNVGR